MSERDAIEKVRILLSAASRAPDMALRALYTAEARSYLNAETARLDGAREPLEAHEAELVRSKVAP